MVDYSQRLSISYYKTIATINEPHKIYLVQHQETGKFYVKKILDVYSPDVYKYLKNNPITGIPRIIDFCEEDSRLILIEEYAAGTTLKEKIASGDLTPGQIGNYMINLCEILEKLHSHNPPLIHRDIKPSNIIITAYDKVMLLDFNAAKYHSNDANRTADTVLLGTQGYAAPEQYGFRESSPQTDIYSIGIILKECTSALSINNHNFDSIIDKCTKLDPEKRYRSVKDLRLALLNLLGKQADSNEPAFPYSAYLPPGFRTMTVWKMVIAIPVYLLIFRVCLTLEVKDTHGAALWFERIFLLLIFLGDVLIGFNYLGVLDKFPPCKSQNKLIHALGVLLMIALFTVASVFILLTIEAVVFGHI